MIQRIQSLYLFLAFAALIAVFFLPLATYFGTESILDFGILEIKSRVPGQDEMFPEWMTWPLAAGAAFMSLIALFSLLSYKKRLRQLQLVKINILLVTLFLLALFFVYNPELESATRSEAEYDAGIFMPVVALVMFVLAYRAIYRDEKLVRSINRLR